MFQKVVEMYRALGRPEINNGTFEFEGEVSAETMGRVRDSENVPDHFGSFLEHNIEGNFIRIEYSLSESEHGRFHKDVEQFILATPTLDFGEIPKEFYIVSLNYYSGDLVVPGEIENLSVLCRLIKALSLLAAEKDAYASAAQWVNRLIFVLAADGKAPAKTLSLHVRMKYEYLDILLVHTRIVEVLVSEAMKNEIHAEERRSIMRIAVAEVVSGATDEKDLFGYLIRNWKSVLTRYRHNVLAFVNQYSFEKVRKEIATAEIDHATKLSGVLGDIGGKLLALPVSLGAVILLRKASSEEEFWVLFVGLLAVSAIFIGILLNQWMQVARLKNSFQIIFGQYDETAYPKKLMGPIRTAKKNMSRQYSILAATFATFSIFALAPGIAAIYVLYDRVPLDMCKACIRLAFA